MNKLKFEKMKDNNMYNIIEKESGYTIGLIGFEEETKKWKDIFYYRGNILEKKEKDDEIAEVDKFLNELNSGE